MSIFKNLIVKPFFTYLDCLVVTILTVVLHPDNLKNTLFLILSILAWAVVTVLIQTYFGEN